MTFRTIFQVLSCLYIISPYLYPSSHDTEKLLSGQTKVFHYVLFLVLRKEVSLQFVSIHFQFSSFFSTGMVSGSGFFFWLVPWKTHIGNLVIFGQKYLIA